jgi:hypothetical protein
LSAYLRSARNSGFPGEARAVAVESVKRPTGWGWRSSPRCARWTSGISGDTIAIAEYPGTDGVFDNAIADIASRYADQNQRDGRIQAGTGI